MVVTGEPAAAGDVDRRTVIWHQLECGEYTADMPLWRELAARSRASGSGGPILDVGAGAGRVALELARAGHEVTALDIDAVLLGELRSLAGDLGVETVCADAREFALARRDYALCLAPMQTVQLLGGSDGRIAFMRRAREHLRPGGVLACAIATDLEPFDCRGGGPSPSPEVTHADGLLYVSRAVRVVLTRRAARIERERSIRHDEDGGGRALHTELDVIDLDLVSVARLHREGRSAGLVPAGTRMIGETDEHVGSTVVMLRA